MPLFAFPGVWLGLLVAGVLAGLVGAVLGAWGVQRVYAPLLASAREREAAATDRLVQAWRDGYTVPSAHGDAEAEATGGDVLDGAVLEFVEQFDAAGAAVYSAKARRLRAEHPEMAAPEIVQRLERERARVNVLDEPYGAAPGYLS